MERHALVLYYHRILHSNYTKLEVHVSLPLTGLGLNFMLMTELSVCINEGGVGQLLSVDIKLPEGGLDDLLI